MGIYTKEQLLHLDLPKEFHCEPVKHLSQVPLNLSWDLILLGMALLSLLENNV